VETARTEAGDFARAVAWERRAHMQIAPRVARLRYGVACVDETLYARLGFQAAGRTRTFHRLPLPPP